MSAIFDLIFNIDFPEDEDDERQVNRDRLNYSPQSDRSSSRGTSHESLFGSNSSLSSEGCKSETKKRCVSINSSVNVILIPSRKEYFTVGLGGRLWWSYEELNSVKLDCHNEIKGLLDQNKHMTIRQALATLYQPSSEDVCNSS